METTEVDLKVDNSRITKFEDYITENLKQSYLLSFKSNSDITIKHAYGIYKIELSFSGNQYHVGYTHFQTPKIEKETMLIINGAIDYSLGKNDKLISDSLLSTLKNFGKATIRLDNGNLRDSIYGGLMFKWKNQVVKIQTKFLNLYRDEGYATIWIQINDIGYQRTFKDEVPNARLLNFINKFFNDETYREQFK